MSFRQQDVLLGKNPKLRNHPGNARLRELVELRYDIYYAADKSQKTKLAAGIIKFIALTGGRFMRPAEPTDSGDASTNIEPSSISWVEVDELEARNKVSSTFRNFKKSGKRKLEATNASAEGLEGQRESKQVKMVKADPPILSNQEPKHDDFVGVAHRNASPSSLRQPMGLFDSFQNSHDPRASASADDEVIPKQQRLPTSGPTAAPPISKDETFSLPSDTGSLGTIEDWKPEEEP